MGESTEPRELYCPTCGDWQPADEMERCDECGESYCRDHRHHDGGGL